MREKCRLYVGNIPFGTASGAPISDEEIREVFRPFGTIVDLYLKCDRDTGRFRGFAYVEYDNPSSASDAILKTNQMVFHGKYLSVQLASPRGSNPLRSRDDENRRETERRGP